jgi:hypothetical protein
MITNFKIYEEINLDLGPYGEENWDNNYITLSELKILHPIRCKKTFWDMKEGELYFVIRVYSDRVIVKDKLSKRYSLDEAQLNEYFEKIRMIKRKK